MKTTLIITPLLLTGCIHVHVDFYWEGTLSLLVLDKETGQGIEDLRLSLSVPQNPIGHTNKEGVCVTDIAPFWGYTENRGLFGLKGRSSTKGPLLYIYKENIVDTHIELPLIEGSQHTTCHVEIEVDQINNTARLVDFRFITADIYDGNDR